MDLFDHGSVLVGLANEDSPGTLIGSNKDSNPYRLQGESGPKLGASQGVHTDTMLTDTFHNVASS